ncbi:glycosyltransferase family 2 protein [Maridesulfovibrio sp.]|uniref:glycosyltransferase family 2 protein n=1 Tax=Maridesulfovibrio sp. TaxID=2795000 RepID=UPI003BA866FB
MADRRLALVILHYGDPALTSRVKEQLEQSDPKWAEHIYVLDNHAPEPFAGAWRRLDDNLYWAGALDYCLKEFESRGYTHLWFLNNDIWFGSKPPHILKAWKRLEHLDAKIGPIGVYSPATHRSPYHPQMIEKPGVQYSLVPYIDGISPLFNIECLNKIGGLDYEGNIYGYGVDVWNSLALHRAGFPVVVDHQVTIRHIYHSTAKKVEGFLAIAAETQHKYMADRLGDNYEDVLKQELASCRDFRAF